MNRLVRGLAGGLTLLAAGAASAQQLGDRPSEQDLFGGSSAAPAPAPAASAPAPPATTTAAPPAAPAPPTSQPGQPAAAAAEGTSRDQEVLGSGDEGKFLSEYVAPENPLQIGGQLYLRAQSTASAHQSPADWSLSAPSLLDVYLDARPNPRVRGFILGRMAFDPTLPPNGTPMLNTAQMGSNGALTGSGTPTGFSTFSNTRGPSTLLDQMWIRFDVLQKVFVTVGKQHVRFGTGRFWQPTDYLHPVKRNPLDVFDARPGETMIKLNIPWEDKGWNFYAFGVTEDPNVATDTIGKVAGAARIEAVVAGVELGADVYLHNGDRPRYGFDLSTGIGDFDVYGDVALRPGGDFFHYDPELNTVGVYTGYETQAVGGLNYSRKYNDNDMWTAGFEYFYNHPGYTDASVYPKALQYALANPTLLSGGNPFSLFPFFYLGRQYAAVFASFPAPYSWNYTTFTFSTLGNLSDKSFISRIDYSVTVLTHLSVEAFVGLHYGQVGGEFRFELPSSLASQLGVSAATLNAYPIVDVGAALRIKI